MNLVAKLCVLVGLLSSAVVSEASSSCDLKDQDLNECMRKSFQENFPTLRNPSENKDFPSIDPYFYDLGEINFSRTVRGKFTAKNVTILGAKAVMINDLQTTFNESHVVIKTNVSLPQLRISGWFKSNATFNDFPFVARGKFKLICEEVSARFLINGKFLEDKKQFEVISIKMIPTVKKMKVDVGGLVADRNLNKVVNQFVNDSWKPIYRDLINDAKPLWYPIALNLFNQLASSIEFIQ